MLIIIELKHPFDQSIDNGFLNFSTNSIEVYDEQLNLIANESVGYNIEQSIKIYQQEQYVGYVTGRGDNNFVFDLSTMKIANNAYAPVVEAKNGYDEITNVQTVQLVDALGRVSSSFSLKNIVPDGGYIEKVYLHGDYVIIVYFFYNNEKEDLDNALYTLTKDGNVVNHTSFPEDTYYSYGAPFISNNQIEFVISDKYNDSHQLIYFDLSTFTFMNKKSLPYYITGIKKIREGIYSIQSVDHSTGEPYSAADFKTFNHQLLYTIGDIAFVGDQFNDNMIIYHEDNQAVYNISNGSKVKDLEIDGIHQFVGQNIVYSIKRSFNNGEFKETGYLYSLFDEPQRPADAYEPTKMWTVTFSKELDENSVNTKRVLVTNETGQVMEVTFSVNGDKLYIYAPSNGYDRGKYKLTIQDLTSKDGDQLKENRTKEFVIW